MRIIIPFILAFILFSCGNTNEKSENEIKIDALESKIELLEERLEVFNAQTQKIDEFKYCVSKIEMLAHHWVENQSRADSQEKMELIQQEKESKELLAYLKNSGDIDKLKPLVTKISKNLDDFLKNVNDIKKALPSFESYEDISNQFLAQVLIEPDGEFSLSVKILILNVDQLKNINLKSKVNTQLEIDKLKLEIKRISS